MKTTLEIPDPLFMKAKVTAAQHGQTLKQFVNDALREKLDGSKNKKTERGWRAVLGKLTPEVKKAAREVDTLVNGPDFRTIDPRDWK